MPEFLTSEEAAEYLTEKYKIISSRRTLEDWRCKLKGPDYWRVGPRVMYRTDDLNEWALSSLVKVSARTGQA